MSTTGTLWSLPRRCSCRISALPWNWDRKSSGNAGTWLRRRPRPAPRRSRRFRCWSRLRMRRRVNPPGPPGSPRSPRCRWRRNWNRCVSMRPRSRLCARPMHSRTRILLRPPCPKAARAGESVPAGQSDANAVEPAVPAGLQHAGAMPDPNAPVDSLPVPPAVAPADAAAGQAGLPPGQVVPSDANRITEPKIEPKSITDREAAKVAAETKSPALSCASLYEPAGSPGRGRGSEPESARETARDRSVGPGGQASGAQLPVRSSEGRRRGDAETQRRPQGAGAEKETCICCSRRLCRRRISS